MSDKAAKYQVPEFDIPKVDKDGNPLSKNEQKRLLKEMKKQKEQAEKAAKQWLTTLNQKMLIIPYFTCTINYSFRIQNLQGMGIS